MNVSEWIQFISMLTAQLLSAVHPEVHTTALIDKAVTTAKSVVDKVAASVPPNMTNAAPVPVIQPSPVPVPATVPVIDYGALAAEILKQQKAAEQPQA